MSSPALPFFFQRVMAVLLVLVSVPAAQAASTVKTARFVVAQPGTSLPQGSTRDQTITVTNAGPDVATSTVITYKPPTTAGVAVNSVTATPGGPCTLASGVYTCPSVPSVAVNAQISLSVNLTIGPSVAVGTSSGSSVVANSAEFNPGSGAGESLLSTWGATGISGAAGDAFWFAFDGNYNDTGYKSEMGSTGTVPLTTDWPVNAPHPRGTYSIKRDDNSYNQSDNPADAAAANSPTHPLPYNAYGTVSSTVQPPTNQSVETTSPTVNLPLAGTKVSQNNRRVWEVRTGIYLNSPQNLFVCVSQPDDAMYVTIDPATSGTIAAFASTYISGVADSTNAAGTPLAAGYHEIVYRIFNRNNQANSYESGIGGFAALGIGTARSTSTSTAEACSRSNYNVFAKIAPASDVTVAPASADLTVHKTGSANVTQGQAASYTVTVWNKGPNLTTNATVADVVPSNLTGVSWSCTAAGGASCGNVISGTGNAINLNTGVLPVNVSTATPPVTGAFLTLTVIGTATTLGTFTNTATVTAAAGVTDATGNNRSSQATVISPPPPSITLTKLVRNASVLPAAGFVDTNIGVKPGETLEYCVAYRNTGGAASNFVIRDYVPFSMVIVPDAYEVSKGVRYSSSLIATVGDTAAPTGSNLTNLDDADEGTLSSIPVPNPSDPPGSPLRPGLLTLRLAGVPNNGQGTVCFRVRVP